MKIEGISARLVLVSAAVIGILSLASCTDPDPFGTTHRASIEPAPAGMPNSGIGAPGGASEDTRSVGTVAASEGTCGVTVGADKALSSRPVWW